MIPSSWSAHRRESDDELVGYLVPDGAAVVPVTLFGYPLGPAGDVEDAIAVLDAEGMACLADPWWLVREVAGAEPGAAPELIKVKIYEATPDHVSVVIDDFGAGAELNTRIDLPVPEAGRLRRRPETIDRPTARGSRRASSTGSVADLETEQRR